MEVQIQGVVYKFNWETLKVGWSFFLPCTDTKEAEIVVKEKAKTYNEILTNYNVVYYNNDQKFYNYDDSLFYCIYRQYIYINDMYNTSL